MEPLVIQRELARNLVLDIAYVGSHGVRLPVQTVNLNQLPLSSWILRERIMLTTGLRASPDF